MISAHNSDIQTVCVTAYTRDLPPRGGFGPVRYKRNLPAKGPSGIALLATMVGLTTFGFYRVGQNNIEKR